MALRDDLITDLTSELEIVDPMFNSAILSIKVDLAIKKVTKARNYPSSYTSTVIESDLTNFYSNIRDIALYEYNKVGADFEKEYSSNGYTRIFVDEKALFSGIRPIARF